MRKAKKMRKKRLTIEIGWKQGSSAYGARPERPVNGRLTYDDWIATTTRNAKTATSVAFVPETPRSSFLPSSSPSGVGYKPSPGQYWKSSACPILCHSSLSLWNSLCIGLFPTSTGSVRDYQRLGINAISFQKSNKNRCSSTTISSSKNKRSVGCWSWQSLYSYNSGLCP